MSSNVHVSFEHPQAYWPWSHGASGFHMADHGIHMPNYYYYQQQQQQQQQHLRNQQHQSVVDHGGGAYGSTSSTAATTYHILHNHRDAISEKEYLFEKPLTPSDVGKLNRLVIPKQHAEKHFPLDGDSGEKGLLLSFEDETGKAWRFRYSYWTSSQSYVLTKGWSRFVKEKRLDAGDVVLFQRRRSDADHLYIGCKRRGDATQAPSTNNVVSSVNTPSAVPWTATNQVLYGAPQQAAAAVVPSYMCIDHNSNGSHHRRTDVAAAPYQSQSQNGGTSSIASSTTTTTTNSKRLRLFGVNLDLECSMGSPQSSSPSADVLQLNQGQFGVPTTHGGQRELQFLHCIDAGTTSYL